GAAGSDAAWSLITRSRHGDHGEDDSGIGDDLLHSGQQARCEAHQTPKNFSNTASTTTTPITAPMTRVNSRIWSIVRPPEFHNHLTQESANEKYRRCERGRHRPYSPPERCS